MGSRKIILKFIKIDPVVSIILEYTNSDELQRLIDLEKYFIDPVSRADHKGDPLGRPNATIVKPSIKLEIKIPPKKARYDKDKEELFYM
jgi:hypothetical protein